MTLYGERYNDDRDWSQTRYGVVECLKVRWPSCSIDVVQGDEKPHQEIEN